MVPETSTRARTDHASRSEALVIVSLIVLWAVVGLAVNPLGDFPLNDDWAYGKAVQRLLATGHFTLPDWTASNHIVQLYWGALFCLPFGFSFTALRFSTLTAGLLGIIGVYGLLRDIHPRPHLPVLGAVVIALNPIFLGMSNTFMTDVPFFTLVVWSLLLFSRGLRKDRTALLLAGLFLAGAALLIKQFGLVLFAAFGAALIGKRGFRTKPVLAGILVVLSGAGLQFLFQRWLAASGRVSAFFGNPLRDVYTILSAGWTRVLLEFLKRALVETIYSGMFLFPVLLVLAVRRFRASPPRTRRWTAVFVAAFVLVTLFEFALHGIRMPFTNNVMSGLGLGPMTLRDASFGPTAFATPLAVAILWAAMTVVGVVGAALVWVVIIAGVRRAVAGPGTSDGAGRWPTLLYLTAIILYVLAILTRTFFDRYLLPLWPLFLVLASLTAPLPEFRRFPRWAAALTVVFIILVGGFGVGATHDYLLWNRVRWEALDRLMREDRVSPRQIDGGFEFNGWYLYSRAYQSAPDRSWWWVESDEYVVAFGPMPGFRPVKRYDLDRWLPFGPRSILVLRKISAGSPPGT